MQETRCTPTLNHMGYQMSTPNPLLQQWIDSYDGSKPLMDIGCAYGINTYKALDKNIPTIAVDSERRHLDILQSNTDIERKQFLITLAGSLPDDIAVPDGSVSGILLSEVLHFLQGEDIPRAFQTIYTKLMPEGRLVLATLHISLFQNKDEKKIAKFFQERENGVKWPGLININADVVSTFRVASKQQNVLPNEFGTGLPKFLHLFVLEQIVNELKEAGFQILEAREGSHPGYPYGDSKITNANIQIVAKKPAYDSESEIVKISC